MNDALTKHQRSIIRALRNGGRMTRWNGSKTRVKVTGLESASATTFIQRGSLNSLVEKGYVVEVEIELGPLAGYSPNGPTGSVWLYTGKAPV